MFQTYAEIAVKIPVFTTFTYLVPENLLHEVKPGMRVIVPFRNQLEEGIIFSIGKNAPAFEVKSIEKIIDKEPLLSNRQIELAEWMSAYYLAGPGECAFKMFPHGKRVSKESAHTTENLQPLLTLNEEQKIIYTSIEKTLDFSKRKDAKIENSSWTPPVHLIHGVTGSGKTEIYIHLIKEFMTRGFGSILLVPEISLTVQLIERLKRVFGSELALLHSALKKTERFSSYMSLIRGDKLIAVGTRSAVFAPVQKLGLIIMDEEHDASYKEHSSPRYHARQIGYRRCEMEGAALLLGSATPSLESYFGANREPKKNFHYHHLKSRAGGSVLPEVHLIPVRSPDIPISGVLINEIDKNLKNGEQTLLLLNRRGYHPFLYCRSCAQSISCPKCSVTLNLHRNGTVQCHYCGYIRRGDENCDRCGGKTSKMGSGTQKLEEYLLRLFPQMRLERLDTDSSKQSVTQDVIRRFIDREIDVLIGTQMIAKGLDAPGVSLVGVLQADMGLNLPDYRASERTFSLLTQVAGRAGRREAVGRVYFEVLDPENPVILFSKAQDYGAFYQMEIESRREALYPPFVRIIRILFRSFEEKFAEKAASKIKNLFLSRVSELDKEKFQFLGPAPAPLKKLNDQYRYHVIIKTLNVEAVRKMLAEFLPEIKKDMDARTHLEIDFDPVDLL